MTACRGPNRQELLARETKKFGEEFRKGLDEESRKRLDKHIRRERRKKRIAPVAKEHQQAGRKITQRSSTKIGQVEMWRSRSCSHATVVSGGGIETDRRKH